ncbi:Glutathione S-transferase C-terminal domain [Phytophthora infestans]|uniref:Glutathione S-transferase C-terminal domain n=1 Tax=Phytophthora infestans TaxID=4787 RepID=A0A833S9G6_PHYIN|nr:Glutathione S-transferase C-terminal domain [Phytophthora infestans]KAF4149144.1 Glutathione S-transferase C-terminal domain-containing protein [Phytophthora infestans]
MAQPQLKLTYFDGKAPTLPFGQVPVLEVDDTVYAQSMAIVRYAAKIAGLYPTDALEALKVDVFSCSLCEIETPFVDFMFLTRDETVKAQKKKVFIEETVPKFLATLEKMVAGTFILGDKLSYADLQFLDVVDNKIKWAFPDFNVDAFPKIAALLSSVKVEPKVAAYLSKQ